MRGSWLLALAPAVGLVVAVGCGGDSCTEGVPFSRDSTVDQAEADRLATALGVASIDGMCDAACTQLTEEMTSPDGATLSVTSVDSCTLVMPSTDGSGNAVAGSLRCSGAGARCTP